MPTYEYRCTSQSCRREFERFQRMSDPPGAPCPECGEAAERLISAGGGLLFKGDGFYITDYRSDAYKDKAKKEGGEGPKEGADGGKDTSGDSGREGGSSAKDGGAERDGGRKGSGGTEKGSRSAEKGSRGTDSNRSGSRRADSSGPKE